MCIVYYTTTVYSYTCIIIIVMADKTILGGWSDIKPADEHVKVVADKVTWLYIHG